MKFVRYQMLVMELFVLGIGFLHNIMKFLLDVLYVINKFGFPINLYMSMGGLFRCGCNGKIYVNGGQWLEPQAHLKREGYGQWSCGGLCCSYVEHKEGSHPMCMDVWNCTSSRDE